MTYEEAEICLKFRLPVVVTKAPHYDCDFMLGETYYICAFETFYQTWSRSYKTTAMLDTMDGYKANYTAPFEYIEPQDDCKHIVCSYLKNKKADDFKKLIGDMMSRGLNQTQILEYTKKITKEIKQ